MRRSLCITEPAYCLAGQSQTFRLIYTPATNLAKGARLRLDIASQGRPIDWEAPQVNLKVKKNLIWAELPDGKEIAAHAVENKDSDVPFYEFTLPVEIKAGSNFTIIIGTPLKSAESGNKTQTMIQRRKPFHLHIASKDKTDFREEEVFHIDVRGNALKNIRITAPSLVVRNKRFDIMVRFEDLYGNLTNLAPEGTLIELSYENLRDSLSWKLFVPETGFINLPNLYFNEAGIYKIRLKNLKTGDIFFSSPIKCLLESPVNLYWGLLHGESEKFDATTHIEACLRTFRDEKALQFFATSPFESAEETPNEVWKSISQHVSELSEDHRFTTFLGFQYLGEEKGEGLRTILYLKEGKPILRKKDAKTNSLQKLYRAVSNKEFLSIPSFTMAKGVETDFSAFDPEVERVVEIYNAWGSSECAAKEGNLRPIKTKGKVGYQESELGSIIKALQNNKRFGFVAGGLDDRAIYEKCYTGGQVQYSPGLTAILATDHTREALSSALQARSCYATTGERIALGFNIASHPIGSELSTKNKPGLVINRHITGFVAGTAPLKEIVIVRNGAPFKTLQPKDFFLEFEIDDLEDLSNVVIEPKDGKPPFVFYYLRAVQKDGHIAWSSPIWIDYPEFEGKKKKKK